MSEQVVRAKREAERVNLTVLTEDASDVFDMLADGTVLMVLYHFQVASLVVRRRNWVHDDYVVTFFVCFSAGGLDVVLVNVTSHPRYDEEHLFALGCVALDEIVDDLTTDWRATLNFDCVVGDGLSLNHE